MAQYSKSEAFAKIKSAAEAKKGELAALSTVQRGLAQLGYSKLPKTEAARTDVGTVRIYSFGGTPLGDLVLVAGPSIETELHQAADLQSGPAGYYIQTTRTDVPNAVQKRLSSEVKAGKADVKAAIEAGEIKAPPKIRESARSAAAAAPRRSAPARAPAPPPAPAPAPPPPPPPAPARMAAAAAPKPPPKRAAKAAGGGGDAAARLAAMLDAAVAKALQD